MNRHCIGLLFAISAVLVSACERAAPVAEEPAAQLTAAPSTSATASSPSEGHLPVSLNAVMVALVNDSADPIWSAATKLPQAEKEWRGLERVAIALEVSGALMTMPGTGPLDETWTQRPEWQGFAKELREAGAAAVAAVKSRDQAAIASVGDRLVDVCEGCHKVFKPDVPTGKVFGEIRHPDSPAK